VFALSIAALSLLQASLIGLPTRVASSRALAFARSRWWALVMPASIVVVIGAIAVAPNVADGLTYLALVAVPPLAAIALAGLVRGGRPPYAIAVVPLFVIAWAARGNLAGELSAYALTALGCVTLGSLLVAVAPRAWVRAGIYAMAVVDVIFVATDLLQHPNSVLQHAAPAAGLPQLQAVVVGSAAMGFGDVFIAATLGALLAAERRPRGQAVAIAACFCLLFDLLFAVVNELPTTVPIAMTLVLLDWGRRSRPVRAPA
jgi:prepilin signal peptidase PulO-like enzyme (type II secretory pathway)